MVLVMPPPGSPSSQTTQCRPRRKRSQSTMLLGGLFHTRHASSNIAAHWTDRCLLDARCSMRCVCCVLCRRYSRNDRRAPPSMISRVRRSPVPAGCISAQPIVDKRSLDKTEQAQDDHDYLFAVSGVGGRTIVNERRGVTTPPNG
ncbi:hypothetical protein LY78DRAFT_425326 [Colletotrichum sublineola]|nr:hypothetical protein LY78DRAFT_425326 [Colletotrichum sublineola]